MAVASALARTGRGRADAAARRVDTPAGAAHGRPVSGCVQTDALVIVGMGATHRRSLSLPLVSSISC